MREQLAGLDKVKLLREPEAAALAYGLDKLEDELILVFDLGGGTLDVSVLEVGGGIIEVVWTGGDSFRESFLEIFLFVAPGLVCLNAFASLFGLSVRDLSWHRFKSLSSCRIRCDLSVHHVIA